MRTASFLLGAGASCDAGLPISKALTKQIVDSTRGKTQAVLRYVIGVLIAERGRAGDDPLEGVDVERVMTALQLLASRRDLEISPFVSSWDAEVQGLDGHSVSEREVKDAIGEVFDRNGLGSGGKMIRVVERIARGGGTGAVYSAALAECTRSLVQVLSRINDTTYLEPIFQHASDQGGEPCLVATLNYDRTVELHGNAVGHHVDTGVEAWSRSGDWEWSDSAKLHLLKLHGSIDWRLAPGRRDTEHGRDWALAESTVEVVADADSGGNRNPALIFGGRNKLRPDGPFLELLTQWERKLQSTDDLIVVGYSFRDDHVNEIIRRWINRDPTRRVVVVEPSWHELNNRSRPKFASEMSLGLAGHAERRNRNDPSEIIQNAKAPRCLIIERRALTGLPLASAAVRDAASEAWSAPVDADAYGRFDSSQQMERRVELIAATL